MAIISGNQYEHLEAVDSQLINVFQSLPVNTWDFRDADVRALSHGIHNYPAIMVYPISRKLISIIAEHQKLRTFLDPYMGSGTCLVEGELAGLERVYGTDLNPLARLISRVKTNPINPNILNKEINSLLFDVDYNFNLLRSVIDDFDHYIREEKGLDITEKDGWGKDAVDLTVKYLKQNNVDMSIPHISNLGYWFLPKVVLELQIIKNCIKQVGNADIRNFLWVCFSEVVRLSSNRRNGEFKMFRIAKDKLVNYDPNVLQLFMNNVQKNEQKMEDFYEVYNRKEVSTEVNIYNNNAMSLEDVPNNSIDIMITSPPYGDSRTTVAYGQFSRTALEWLDLHEDFNDEEEITEKDIRAIDRTLLGGKSEKEIDFSLNSQTLREAYEEIKDLDEKRSRDVYAFYKDLDQSLEAITKKMKPNSYQCWVVGNRTVKGVQLKTHEIIKEFALEHGVTYVTTLGRDISNKVMPSLNSPTNKTGKKVATMTNEHIVILRKE